MKELIMICCAVSIMVPLVMIGSVLSEISSTLQEIKNEMKKNMH